ncbi:MAG: hypothetical protein GOU98_04505 [Candidatus Altiarchaeota archaeon]|nr:hypothetical protein [Candidatus Altiarchaeota archaeon]
MRNIWVLGLAMVFVILAPGAFFIMGNQQPFPVENTESIQVLDTLSIIEASFPKKAGELRKIINEASQIEKELREQNSFVRFFVGAPIEKIRRLSQMFNETEEKLADVFSLAYSVENTNEIHAATKEVRSEMFEIWNLAQEFGKSKGLFGFLR